MKIKYFLAFSLFSLPLVSSADQFFETDVIAEGSLCVGLDCIPGEDFGFSSVRLKENNLRIEFRDTSISAAFPTTDWQITINDSTDGGDNYFGIEDLSANTMPFRVNNAAPNNSLLVGSTGFIGLGSASPMKQLHLSDGNEPTIRLEQDGSGGFTPVIWDIAANENDLSFSVDGSEIFTLNANGNLTITGSLTAGNPPETFPVPDYVFSESYTLMPLSQVQEFIDTNSHLPGVPSASEVEANGLNMTEMQMHLLKKVEELHLYTLQQQALIDELQAQVQALSGSQ